MLGLAGVDQLRIQSGVDCGGGGDDYGYADHFDDGAKSWDWIAVAKGSRAAHGWDPSTWLRAGSWGRTALHGHAFLHSVILHARVGGAGGNGGSRAKEMRRAASLRRDRGHLFGAGVDGADFLRRGRGAAAVLLHR